MRQLSNIGIHKAYISCTFTLKERLMLLFKPSIHLVVDMRERKVVDYEPKFYKEEKK